MKKQLSLFLFVSFSLVVFSCGMDQRVKEAAEARQKSDSILKEFDKISKEIDSIGKNMQASGDSAQKALDSAMKELEKEAK